MLDDTNDKKTMITHRAVKAYIKSEM